MMEWYKDGLYPEWHISGENFSPKEFVNIFPNVLVTSSHEKGDLGEFKWNKNEKYNYGSCVVVVEQSIIQKLEWLLDFIIKNGKAIRKLGVNDELIWLIWHGSQGNMELDSNLILKLAKTGLNMNMNYYYIKEEKGTSA